MRRCDNPTHKLVPNKAGGVVCQTCKNNKYNLKYAELRAKGLTRKEIKSGAGSTDDREYYPWQHYDFGGH